MSQTVSQAPYRDIYHLLNRSLSGITLEQYIKSGWQHFYTARAADGRRLDNFSDGLNNPERNAQDALSVTLIRKVLQGKVLPEAVLWLRHNRDPSLLDYLVPIISGLLDRQDNTATFVLREFAGVSHQSFAGFLRNERLSQSTAYRQRFVLRKVWHNVYEKAVHLLEPHLQSQGLIRSL